MKQSGRWQVNLWMATRDCGHPESERERGNEETGEEEGGEEEGSQEGGEEEGSEEEGREEEGSQEEVVPMEIRATDFSSRRQEEGKGQAQS